MELGLAVTEGRGVAVDDNVGLGVRVGAWLAASEMALAGRGAALGVAVGAAGCAGGVQAERIKSKTVEANHLCIFYFPLILII